MNNGKTYFVCYDYPIFKTVNIYVQGYELN